MDASRSSHLFFLLSTVSVAAGCSLNIDGLGDDGAVTDGTGGASDGTDTRGTTSSDDGTTGSGHADTTGGESAGGASTGAVDTSATSGGEGTTGGPATLEEICQAHAAKYVECRPSYAGYEAQLAESCLTDIGSLEGECRSAFEELYACLAISDCAEWESDAGACPAETDALSEACPELGDGGA